MGTDGEVDFVTIEDGKPIYFQVAQTTLDDKVLERELLPLRSIEDNYSKFLLTLGDVFDEMDYGGIQKKNALKWMLDK